MNVNALVPVAYAEQFGRRIAGSRVEVLEDCGHVLQADRRFVPVGDDQVVVPFGILKLPLRLKQERARRTIELPRALVARAVLNGLGEIIHRCLAKDPNDRFRTPEALLKHLGN